MDTFARLRRFYRVLVFAALPVIAAVPSTAALDVPPNTWIRQSAPEQTLSPGRSGSFEGRGWNHLRFHAASRQMILYDGYVEPPQYPTGNIYANCLWLYDASTNRLTMEKLSNWTRQDGRTVPLQRNTSDPTPFDRHPYSCIVYSASHNALYLWSGANNSIADGYVGDMWTYSFGRKAWRQIPGPHPFTVFEQAMSYDPHLEKIVLFGGGTSGYREGTNTFVFDLKTELWTDVTPALTPSPRFGQSLCFDPVRRVTWMFGGGPYQEATDELWSFDARTGLWSRAAPAGDRPGARRFANLAYDTRRNRILLWGGVTGGNAALSDTWVLDPARLAWSRIEPAAAPPSERPVYAQDMDYDPVNDVFVLNRAGEFWLFRLAGAGSSPPETPEAPGIQFRLLSENPSRAETRMSFTLDRESAVRIDLIDSLGRRVSTLVEGRYPAGEHRVDWAGGATSRRAASGVYYLRLTAGGKELKRRVVLVR